MKTRVAHIAKDTSPIERIVLDFLCPFHTICVFVRWRWLAYPRILKDACNNYYADLDIANDVPQDVCSNYYADFEVA